MESQPQPGEQSQSSRVSASVSVSMSTMESQPEPKPKPKPDHQPVGQSQRREKGKGKRKNEEPGTESATSTQDDDQRENKRERESASNSEMGNKYPRTSLLQLPSEGDGTSLDTYNIKPMPKCTILDNKAPGYGWLLPGWVAEERLMPSGRLYKYYYDPEGNVYNTKSELLTAWEKFGMILLDK